MNDPLAKLIAKADSVAESASALVRQSIRDIQGEISVMSKELRLGVVAKDREKVEKMILRRMADLSVKLNELMERQNELAAKAAAKSAGRLTGMEVKYDARRAEAITALVTPKQGENLAAVFTDQMGAHAIGALRYATVKVMREQAVQGGGMKAMARALEREWLKQAHSSENFQFKDAGGHVWDTRTYMQMNVRTNAMRVYNDCLVDNIAQATGGDLARISTGGDPNCPLCGPWDGVIVSISGKTKGLPTYEQAREAGCFHPNCVHTLEYVDEIADEEEIELQKAHPVNTEEEATDPDAADERKYAIDQDRYRQAGMSAEEARVAVDRDNLAASIRHGLIRDDAREIVDRMTDAQVTALCPNGNPPTFEPTKGTKKNPEPERWNHGSRGGTVHIDRNATLERILDVCGVRNATSSAASVEESAQEAARRAAEERTSLLNEVDSTLPRDFMDTLGGTFSTAPIEVIRAIAGARSKTTCDLPSGRAHCEYGGTSVHLSRLRGWGNSPATLAHEKGHAVLNSQGQKSGEAIQDRYKGIATAAQAEVATWANGVYGRKWKSECRPSRKLWYTEIGEKVFGFTREEMNSSLEKNKAASAVSDIFCAATLGRQFFGHSGAYYRSGEARPTHEIVANVTSLLCSPYVAKARAVIPQTMQAVETAVYGISQTSKTSADTSRTKSS